MAAAFKMGAHDDLMLATALALWGAAHPGASRTITFGEHRLIPKGGY